MAHIVVYLQRTPLGLHPASALALCWGRDYADTRGATVTAVASGDAGRIDDGLRRAAARFGADMLIFCGPEGVEHTHRRLRPVHVLTPWTTEGLAAVHGLPGGPVTPRHLCASQEPLDADSISGVVAGTLPWHDLVAELEPEYLGAVDGVALPPWVIAANLAIERGEASAPVFTMTGRAPLRCVAPAGLDADVVRRLAEHGTTLATPTELAGDPDPAAVALWLVPGAGAVPEAMGTRPGPGRALLLPGPDASFDPSWSAADLVVSGSWPEAIAKVHEGSWRALAT